MYNFVQILRAPECYGLCGQLTDHWTASALIKLTSDKRKAQATSDKRAKGVI